MSTAALDLSDGAPRALRGAETLRAAFAVMGRNQTTDLRDPTAFELCLTPYLQRIGWVGETRRLIEALPHFDPIASMDDFRLVLANLDAPSSVRRERLDQLSSETIPCVYDGDHGPCVVLAKRDNGDLQLFCGATGTEYDITPSRRYVSICVPTDALEEIPDDTPPNWFALAFAQFRKNIGFLIALTLTANLLALATPLFSMAVYNNVLPTREMPTLIFAIGVIVGVLVFEDYLRRLRNKVIATNAARLNATILREGFGRILALPLAMTLTAPVATQTARLKQFETIFGVFTGGLASAILDSPFTLIFLIAIWIIGGPLIYVPLALLIVFLLLAAVVVPITRANTMIAGKRRTEAATLARQTIFDADTIRGLGAERIWMRRIASAMRRASAARMRAAFFDQLLNSAAQCLTMLAGVLTLFTGTLLVIEGQLSIGGLIAVMMFVWRLFAPIQTAFLSAHQLLSARDSVSQINNLMKLPTERRARRAATIYRTFKGDIRADGLTFKYPNATDFALRGVSFEIPAGQMVAVIGPSGAGKTTLLKLLLGLHKPLGGSVYIDGLNLAQLDPSEVRTTFGFSAEKAEFFFGTLAQNFRLVHPTATDDEIEAELRALGVDVGGRDAPDGLSTRINAEQLARTTESLRHRIGVARTLVKRSPIQLFDSPTELLDANETAQVRHRLAALRGEATVVVSTAKPDIMRICDRVLVLDRGQLVADSTPDEILRRLEGRAGQ